MLATLQAKIIAGLIIAAVLGGGIAYVRHLVVENNELNGKVTQLEADIKQKDDDIRLQGRLVSQTLTMYSEARRFSQNIRSNVTKFETKHGGSIGKVGETKPDIVKVEVQRYEDDYVACLNSITKGTPVDPSNSYCGSSK
jgi:hypothetical protein